MKRTASASIILAVLLGGCAANPTQLPPLIPRQVFFDNPHRANPQISPDGNHLSFLAPDKHNVMQVWISGLDGQTVRQLTYETKRGVSHYTWTYDNQHLIYAQDANGDENWQIHTIHVDSGNIRNLTPYKGVQAFVAAMDPRHPDAVLIGMNLRNRRYYDVYRLQIVTGETLLIHRNNGNQRWWVADRNLRINTIVTNGGVLIRDEKRQWKLLRRWQSAEPGGVYGYANDDNILYMRGLTADGDTGALLGVDVATGRETILFEDPNYDVEGIFVHPTTRAIQAVSIYRDKLQWQILDPTVARDFEVLATLEPGELRVHHSSSSPVLASRGSGRRDLRDRYWIVSYEADDAPVRHYLYDRTIQTATFLFSERPRLQPHQLAKVQPISYRSRDGLTIHGYLTTPVGIAPRNLPTVLLVHGGPWRRDRWGYDDVVQWLANRGYAVLQINYRGSTGYGRKFLLASYKEWGGKMHDDLIDGVNWLVKEEIADPKRVAIMGASYGGYAALVGMTLTPDTFAAGVSRVGISNLLTSEKSVPLYWAAYRAQRLRRVGDPDKDEEMLKSRSPLYFVDQVKAPILIAHGANDVRVVAAESAQMAQAMRRANKPVEYFVYDDEGHSLTLPANKFHFYAKAEEFLAKHLGGRYEAAAEQRAFSAPQ